MSETIFFVPPYKGFNLDVANSFPLKAIARAHNAVKFIGSVTVLGRMTSHPGERILF
jgi:hypothetical protein